MNVQLIPLAIENDPNIYMTESTESRVRIGRADDCDIQLTDASVSRRHCELIFNGDKLFVRDLKSSNGTFVNCQRIHDEHPLNDGDLLTVASTIYRVHAVPTEALPMRLYYRLLRVLQNSKGCGERNSTGQMHEDLEGEQDQDLGTDYPTRQLADIPRDAKYAKRRAMLSKRFRPRRDLSESDCSP